MFVLAHYTPHLIKCLEAQQGWRQVNDHVFLHNSRPNELKSDLLLLKKSMANTYTQLYVQFVFAVKYRIALIQP